MDTPTEDFLNALEEPILSGDDTTEANSTSPEQSNKNDGKKRGWRGLSALKAQASLQDKLLERSVLVPAPTSELQYTSHPSV